MPNPQNLKPFQKGDPRINRRGRPKNLDVIRQISKELCYEPVDLSVDTVARTRVEAILREWITSGDFRKQRAVIQYAFGRIPNKPEAKKSNDRIIVEWETVVPLNYDQD